MCDIEAEGLEQIKEQAFLEGVIGTLTRLKFLVEREKDPAVAVKKLFEAIDNYSKSCVDGVSAICVYKLARKIGPLKP